MTAIYDGWTPEDFQRLNRLPMKRKLVALKMVRHGDRPDAQVMLRMTMMRRVSRHRWAGFRNYVVLVQAWAQ